ncbi:MAG: hypothetical protein A2722_00840 [Candidatus Doudnabacteria bacterium RIFCSPHIGHO2_01_FULL_50_11]|uniref:Heat-inducible transcription repressor HrcA n=1 Tax=Candidatus Doudnabacteria bacterium RIFCSPHIGHO2_01_FULL_50_11 TaxID=1817828 RepID=A0A1F5PG50_9BACT|nr:MAG: hypothetical protein A2722_00840 [Candidatus Doudnabacteria bacterium RIFCSPHIGHO2_01_FULL_50_11]HLC45222.1 hypothetical protein [Patescibacteria group bacterium]
MHISHVTARQAKILAAIVKEYTNKSEPVGSEMLEHEYEFGLSSATIRNEMKALERAGLIAQPYTSAGRVPTDVGYRYFITQLMKHVELSSREQQRLQAEIRKLQEQYHALGQSIARLLADSSNSAAFALLPEATATSGFGNIVSSGLGQDNLQSVADFLDNLDQKRKVLLPKHAGGTKTFIGADSPVRLSRDVSMIVSQVKLPDGKKGLVGIIGSKRMKYAKNISLLEYVSKLLSGALLFTIILHGSQ